MKISTGMAEIYTLNPNRVVSEKLFTWPVYDAGKVNHIRGVARRTDNHATYTKPTAEDHVKLLDSLRSSSYREYAPTGRSTGVRYSSYQPGSFFDALA